MDCNTKQISPNATSSLRALPRALAKSDAVAFIGKPGKGFADISLICRFIFPISPFFAKSDI